MKASLKKIKDCRVRLVVEVEPELIEAKYQVVLKDIQKVAHLPGFRPGKAPLEMVERKYSKEAEEETLKALIPEAYHQSVRTQQIQPVTLPAISDIDFQRGKKLSFAAEFEQAPELKLKNYKGIKLKRESNDVSDEDMKKGVQSLLESRAELIPIVESRAVQKGDFVVSDIELWQDGKYAPGKEGVLLFVEPSEHDDFYDKILGAKEGEFREVSHKPTDEEKAKGDVLRPHYKVWIRSIKEKKLPEMSDDFAKSFGKDSVALLEDAIRKDVAQHKHSQSVEKMRKELFEKLLEQNQFVVPEELLAKQKERLMEQTRRQYAQMGIPESKFNQELERIQKEVDKRAEEQVRLYFILGQIAEAENIDVDEIELHSKLEALAQESKRPIEEVRRMFEDDLRESMTESKTVDFLIANAKFD